MRDVDLRGSRRRERTGARAVLKRILTAIGTAVAYFSIFPAGRFTLGPAPDAEALLALPLVGALIGALAGFAALGVSRFAPHGMIAALALGILVIASGAIHLDGFLDGCDAFFASVAPERRLEILKDPRHGSFALAGLLVLGTAWYSALVALPIAAYPAILTLAGALGRGAAISAAAVYPYARGGRVDRPVLALLLALVACGAFLIAPMATLLVPIAVVVALLVARWIAGRLGGDLPGDGYGFIATVLDAGTVCAAAVVFAAGGPGVAA